jgi:hypothetical protein
LLMSQRYKTANTIFFDAMVIMECPFCGMTLIKTDYRRIRKLLEETDTVRGKQCKQCGEVVVIRLNTQAREELLMRIGEHDPRAGGGSA